MTKAQVWKEQTGTDRYGIQINGINPRSYNKIIRLLEKKKWRIQGEGHDKDGKCIIIANRDFASKKDMEKWALTFPYKAEYSARSGNTTKIKTKASK